jgi:hypothetical protein
MELFVYENYTVDIDPKALFITAFRDIWEKYKNKEDALAEFSYIWFVGSYTSDFADIIDGELRRKEVLHEVFAKNKSKLKIDDKTELAIEKLEKLQSTPALNFLRTAHEGIEKLRDFISAADIEGRDGREASALMKIITDAPGMVKSLRELELQIKAEAADSGRVKGKKKKGMMED